MELQVKDLENRLTKLEEWRILVDIQRAKEEVDRQYIKEKFDGLERNLTEFKDRINTMSNKLIWAIATPIISAIVAFALSGKLFH